MDVRITPYSGKSSYSTYSTLLSQRKSGVKANYFSNKDPSLLEQPRHSTPSIQAKKTSSINNNSILILSKRNTDNPKFGIKITSSMIQPPATADKKGALLYQQIVKLIV